MSPSTSANSPLYLLSKPSHESCSKIRMPPSSASMKPEAALACEACATAIAVGNGCLYHSLSLSEADQPLHSCR